MKKETHTFYNYQFKHTAVSVSNHEHIQVQDVADALNIHPFMLSRWKKQMRDGILKDNDQEARSVSELNAGKKKIKKLERNLKQLREENTVLKKAERIFPGKK